jgi:hypothetical protein
MIPKPNENDLTETKKGDNIPIKRSFLKAKIVNGSTDRTNPVILKIKG